MIAYRIYKEESMEPSTKMKTYDSFKDWLANQKISQKKTITKIRKLVKDVAPQLVESSKWGNGVWLKGDLPIIYIHTKIDHIQFGFFAGATFTDPQKILKGTGKFIRHVRIEQTIGIDEVALSTMVRKTIKAPRYK